MNDRGDYFTFRHKLSQVNWANVFSTNDVNECAGKFTDSIMRVVKDSIPNKSVTIRPLETLWINSQIKREIRKRKHLFRKAKRTNAVICWNKFKQKRNDVTIMIREAKKQYNDKLISDMINTDTNSKRWHKVVNQIITPQINEFSQIPFLEVGDEITESDYDVADALNIFFAVNNRRQQYPTP